jgi:hypothetical protein
VPQWIREEEVEEEEEEEDGKADHMAEPTYRYFAYLPTAEMNKTQRFKLWFGIKSSVFEEVEVSAPTITAQGDRGTTYQRRIKMADIDVHTARFMQPFTRLYEVRIKIIIIIIIKIIIIITIIIIIIIIIITTIIIPAL